MKIKFVNEIPQWIISSDVAAYHPASKTIWIRNNLGWKTIPTLLHELTHWFIHKFLGNNEKLHSEADKLLKYNYGIKYFKRFRAWRRWACRMLNFSRMCLPTFAKPVLYEVPTCLR